MTMTSVKVRLKDPDGLYEAVDDAVREMLDPLDISDEEYIHLCDVRREEALKVIRERFMKYGEYLTVEFDLKDVTARVVPLRT